MWDARLVAAWVLDERALFQFTGSRIPWPLSAGQLIAMEEDEDFAAFVVERHDGKTVGHFDVTVVGHVARLGRIIIDPRLRGQGYAVPLVTLAVERAQQVGASTARLNVVANNTPAVRAYRRAGFDAVAGFESPGIIAMTKRIA
jgi:ribosomal protein S18 acetylase RimI-like enzyme